jgi:hypothetical protein
MISLIFLVLNLSFRPYSTDGLNHLQISCLLVNVFTLFVGIMLIITASLEEAAKRAGQQVDTREHDIISIIMFVSNMFVIGLPVLRTFMAGPLPGMISDFVMGFFKKHDRGLFDPIIDDTTKTPVLRPESYAVHKGNTTSSNLPEQCDIVVLGESKQDPDKNPEFVLLLQQSSSMTPPCEIDEEREGSSSHKNTADTSPFIMEPVKPSFCQKPDVPSHSRDTVSNKRAVEYLAPFVQYVPHSSEDDNPPSFNEQLTIPFAQLQRLSPTKLFHHDDETSQDIHSISKQAAEYLPPSMLVQHLASKKSGSKKRSSVRAWMNSDSPNTAPTNLTVMMRQDYLETSLNHNDTSTIQDGGHYSSNGASRGHGIEMQLDADLIFCSNWTPPANSNNSNSDNLKGVRSDLLFS